MRHLNNTLLYPTQKSHLLGQIFRGLLLLLLFVALPSEMVGQNSSKVKKMQRESTELKKKIKDSENLLVSKKKDVASQMKHLELLNSQIGQQQDYIKQIKHETDSLNQAIGVLEKELVQLRKELDICKSNYRRAMTYVSKTRLKQSRWTYIFMAKDFRTMYRRMRYASEFSKNQQSRGEIIKKKEAEVKAKQDELLEAKATKDELMKEAKITQENLKGKKEERETLVQELNKQKKKLEQNLAQQRKKFANLNQQIDRLIQQEIAAAEARRKAAEAKRKKQAAEAEAKKKAEGNSKKGKKGKSASKSKETTKKTATPKFHEPDDVDAKLNSNFAANRGKLPPPVAGGFSVTSKFGRYQVDGLANVTLDNKGCNLTAPSGARAQSIFEGEVTKVVNIGGAYTIIIRHGSYYSVYSNLSAVHVTAGTKVSARQGLGVLAGDGAGNSMLHFQLRHNTEKLNPLSWIRH